MANQPSQARPWFRLGSIARPATAPTPTPAPAPAPTPAPAPEPTQVQPRPPLARPTFRPIGQPQPTQPTQPQEPTPPPPATVVATPKPTPASTNGVASVPSSPTTRASATSASLPSSPAPKTSPTPTALPVTTTPSSVPSSPKPRVSAPSSSVPTSPAPKAVPSTSSVPTSPVPKAVSTSPVKTVPTSTSVTTSPVARAPTTTTISSTTVPATMTRVPTPIPSPKPIKPVAQTPPASPKPKVTAPPPSPLILPPSQIKSDADHQLTIPLEAEQKTVLVQKTIEKPKAWLNGSDSSIKPGIAHGVKKEVSKDVETKEKGHHKKFSSDSDEAGMRVITIAGENKGALMEVIHSPKKHGGNPHFLQKKGHPKASDGSEWHSYSSSSGEEGSSKMKDKSNKAKATPSLPMSAFMNSNVQGVNNSIVFNSSCTHHDPGVHVALSRKPSGGGFEVKDHGHGHQ